MALISSTVPPFVSHLNINGTSVPEAMGIKYLSFHVHKKSLCSLVVERALRKGEVACSIHVSGIDFCHKS